MSSRSATLACLGIAFTMALGACLESSGPQSGSLTVALDSTLNFAGDSVIATTITSADLYDSHNRLVSHGQASGTKWQFTFQGISSGDYFISVNGIPISGLGSYPVVVRIDNPSLTITESVAQTLRNGVIQTGTSLYQFRTYSQGNGEPPIVKFSDTSNVTPLEWPYLVVSLAGSSHRLEVRALGTAALVNSYIASQTAPPSHAFGIWLLGDNNHCSDTNFPADSACSGCHGYMRSKPATFSAVSWPSGWCFRCHNGVVNHNTFVDPSK